MIARFVGKTDVINGMLIMQGREYNVEHIHSMTELLYFRISELDSYNGTLLSYRSWSGFYVNWQPMEEVKDWRYIPNWPEKRLTCAFCGIDKSVKYEVAVKDVNGKNCRVPCCNMCIVKHMNH